MTNFDNGTPQEPGVSFGGDATGFYRRSITDLAITLNGQPAFSFNNGSLTSTKPVRVTGGSESKPSLSFSGGQSSGLYLVSPSSIGVSVDGHKSMEISPNHIRTTSVVDTPELRVDGTKYKALYKIGNVDDLGHINYHYDHDKISVHRSGIVVGNNYTSPPASYGFGSLITGDAKGLYYQTRTTPKSKIAKYEPSNWDLDACRYYVSKFDLSSSINEHSFDVEGVEDVTSVLVKPSADYLKSQVFYPAGGSSPSFTISGNTITFHYTGLISAVYYTKETSKQLNQVNAHCNLRLSPAVTVYSTGSASILDSYITGMGSGPVEYSINLSGNTNFQETQIIDIGISHSSGNLYFDTCLFTGRSFNLKSVLATTTTTANTCTFSYSEIHYSNVLVDRTETPVTIILTDSLVSNYSTIGSIIDIVNISDCVIAYQTRIFGDDVTVDNSHVIGNSSITAHTNLTLNNCTGNITVFSDGSITLNGGQYTYAYVEAPEIIVSGIVTIDGSDTGWNSDPKFIGNLTLEEDAMLYISFNMDTVEANGTNIIAIAPPDLRDFIVHDGVVINGELLGGSKYLELEEWGFARCSMSLTPLGSVTVGSSTVNIINGNYYVDNVDSELPHTTDDIVFVYNDWGTCRIYVLANGISNLLVSDIDNPTTIELSGNIKNITFRNMDQYFDSNQW